MGVEIEAPALQATWPPAAPASKVMCRYGLSLHDFTLAYLQRLKALGAQVPFVKVDEPFFFGSVRGRPALVSLRRCQRLPRKSGITSRLVKSVYPNVAVGDVEPIIASAYAPNVGAALRHWHETYRTVTGARLPFFFADIDFSNPAWPLIVKSSGAPDTCNAAYGSASSILAMSRILPMPSGSMQGRRAL